MSSSLLFAHRSLAFRARNVRFNSSPASSSSSSSKTPFNKGPSSVENDAQISENRGKTTQLVLPLTAVTLLAGALYWFTSGGDKKQITNVGLASEGGPHKLQSQSAKRALEKQQ